MEYSDFKDVMAKVFAKHGRKEPSDTILTAAFEDVKDAPDAFAPAIKAAFGDMERLPVNIGRYARRVLLPQFLAARRAADLGIASGAVPCGDPACTNGCHGTGWHAVWRLDDPSGTPAYMIPCVCNEAVPAFASGGAVEKHALEDLLASGEWTDVEPAPAVPAGTASAGA